MKRWEYRIWTKVIIPLEGWGWRAALALAFLAFSVSRLHADDSLFVHDLAHAAGGGMVATASDAVMDALKPVPWYTRLAVNVGMAVLVDETYEAGTGKSAGLSWTHNAWAGLAGVAVTGISLRWRF